MVQHARIAKKTATFGSSLKEILPPLEQCSSSGAARELIFLYGYVFKIQIFYLGDALSNNRTQKLIFAESPKLILTQSRSCEVKFVQ